MSELFLKNYFRNIYGDVSLIRLTGGYTNETYLLDGIKPLLVAKVSNSFNKEFINEVNCMKLTQKKGIVPKFYDLLETDNFQITIMEYREGENGQSILDADDLERTKEIYKQLGKILAKDIHSIKYPLNPKGIKECNLKEICFDLSFISEELSQTSKKMISDLNDSKKKWVLTHGDYGVHNVLYSQNKELTVLDWEWSEWANPLNDIGWVCWFTRLHYPDQANILNRFFVEEYRSHNPIHLSNDELQGYCIYKVWKVLNRIIEAPLAVKEEWNRRLKWTIETDIFEFIN